MKSKTKLHPLIMAQFSKKQQDLILKHGTVSQFAIACHECVPSIISYDEAEAAIQKYRNEFNEASK